jgi:hypothetical protein
MNSAETKRYESSRGTPACSRPCGGRDRLIPPDERADEGSILSRFKAICGEPLMMPPLAELKELRPDDRELLIEGFRETEADS